MSRIGKQPVVIPSGVQVKFDGNVVTAKGPKGELKEALHPYVKAEIKDGKVLLTADIAAARDASAIWGMTRARLNNLVPGVATGYSKLLEIHGLGFRAEIVGQKLTLALGKSHPVLFEAPKGITIYRRPEEDPDHGLRREQGHGRRNRRQDPRTPQARALQGNGNPLSRRIRPQEGR